MNFVVTSVGLNSMPCVELVTNSKRSRMDVSILCMMLWRSSHLAVNFRGEGNLAL